MIDAFLAALAVVLAPIAWVSMVLLTRAAAKGPNIGALTERAWVAALIGLMLTTGGLITLNRLTGYSLFAVDAARLLFSLSLVALAFVPVAWIVLLLTGRLGDGS